MSGSMSAWMNFFSGVLAMGYLVGALFFLKFWRRIGDPLFLTFAGGFALLAVQQTASAAFNVPEDTTRAALYLMRLAAFGLIIWGVLRNILRRRRS